MRTSKSHTKPVRVGRPRTSPLSRAEQLRLAKRAQRQRENRLGQTEARIKLPRELSRRLKFAMQQSGFVTVLTEILESETIEVERFAQLRLLCWNRHNRYLAAEDVWSLYDRNWRFVDPGQLEPAEKELIATLSARFGGGLLLV